MQKRRLTIRQIVEIKNERAKEKKYQENLEEIKKQLEELHQRLLRGEFNNGHWNK